MAHPPSTASPHDVNAGFRGGARSLDHLDRINKASAVALTEAGVLAPDVARRVASGILQVIDLERGAPRDGSADYLDYEPKLLAAIGVDGSRLHSGRSRQDISATIARMNLRDGLLDAGEALNLARESLLALARQHRHTLIPAYTHGVQAQPTTLAHYLLGLAGALDRNVDRMRAAHGHVNRSPLGAAALTTSSFPIDRRRLADLLGFDGPVENAYDANHLAPVDSSLEVAAVLGIAAVQVGQFAQDLHAQYQAPVPWITLQRGELVGVSSIMPQKRNPAALEQLRVQSSILLGESQTVALTAHNVRTGMFDYRAYDPVPSARALLVFELLRKVLGGLVVDKDRARAEIDSDYSTATEVADLLAQRANVPFRTGHEFASVLTDFGRSGKIALRDITHAEAARLYESMTSQPMPLSAQEFAEATSAEHMVFGRKGLGGPQVEEVDRMLAHEARLLQADLDWVRAQRDQLSKADARLDAAISAIAKGSTPSITSITSITDFEVTP